MSSSALADVLTEDQAKQVISTLMQEAISSGSLTIDVSAVSDENKALWHKSILQEISDIIFSRIEITLNSDNKLVTLKDIDKAKKAIEYYQKIYRIDASDFPVLLLKNNQIDEISSFKKAKIIGAVLKAGGSSLVIMHTVLNKSTGCYTPQPFKVSGFSKLNNNILNKLFGSANVISFANEILDKKDNEEQISRTFVHEIRHVLEKDEISDSILCDEAVLDIEKEREHREKILSKDFFNKSYEYLKRDENGKRLILRLLEESKEVNGDSEEDVEKYEKEIVMSAIASMSSFVNLVLYVYTPGERRAFKEEFQFLKHADFWNLDRATCLKDVVWNSLGADSKILKELIFREILDEVYTPESH